MQIDVEMNCEGVTFDSSVPRGYLQMLVVFAVGILVFLCR